MFLQTLFSFFTDPVLRAPTIGCMLMCLAASLIGVVLFLRKQSLVGEALSHAAYPGVILGVLLAGAWGLPTQAELWLSLFTLGGAFLTALFGFWMIQALGKWFHIPSDAALCFVLSTFFGVGLTMASEVQFIYPGLYKQVMSYLYGQAATMTDLHIGIYGCLAFFILVTVVLLYKELQVMTFDCAYAKSLGIPVREIDALTLFLVALAVVIGIRSVGVVLMSAMLIAPVVAARQFTHRLSLLFWLAAFFGIASGFLGNYFSVQGTDLLMWAYPSSRLILPTGPMIVAVASAICLGALVFAPERGLLSRCLRIARFRYVSVCENLLKSFWRRGPDASPTLSEVRKFQGISKLYLRLLLWGLVRKGWLEKHSPHRYRLTADGEYRAAKIVRLHRLWEVYLAHYLEVGGERVHRNAEEMEHILTPELERELTLLLKDPKKDPHQQAIPPAKEAYGGH